MYVTHTPHPLTLRRNQGKSRKPRRWVTWEVFVKKVSKDFPGGVCEEPGVSKSRFTNSYLEICSSMSALFTLWGGSHTKEPGRKSKTARQGDTKRMGDSPGLGRF